LSDWILESVFTSGSFPYPGGTLTLDAVRAATNLPWWYLPTWFAASIPLGLLFLLLVGLGAWGYQILGKRLTTPEVVARLLILAQAFGLGAAAILLSATMYNAQRHHLYVYPPLAVIAGAGALILFSKVQMKSSTPRRIGSWGIAALLAFALLYPTGERLRLFPYEYVYLNEIATLGGFNGRWETDYWGTSLREALSRVPNDGSLEVIGPQEFLNVYPHLRGSNLTGGFNVGADEYPRINVTIGGMRLSENCREVDSVTRRFRGEDVVMSWVGICKELPGGRSATQ